MTTIWQPTGNVHPLDEAVIASRVPAASGVYGLHNEHQQLFIGEAADLRDALLLHCRQAAIFFRGRQPTHFVFETCDAATRATRAQGLIAAHRPAVRSLQPFSLASLPAVKDKKSAGAGEPSHPPEWPDGAPPSAATAPPKYLSRGQLATLLMLSMVTAAVAGYLGVLAGQQIAERRIAVLQWAEFQRRAAPDRIAAAPIKDAASGISASAIDQPAATPSDSEAPTKPVQVVQASTVSGDSEPAVAAIAASQTAAAENKPAALVTSKRADVPWSVQIAATQDQKAAEEIQSKLKAKGFDAYVVEAELPSGRWYRVRVGRFSARQEADATQQALLAKANIRGAFVTAK